MFSQTHHASGDLSRQSGAPDIRDSRVPGGEAVPDQLERQGVHELRS